MTYARRPLTIPEARQLALSAIARADRLRAEADALDPDMRPADGDDPPVPPPRTGT